MIVGRAIYSITESKDLSYEHFFVPVNDSLKDYMVDDTWIYTPEFNCKVYPIPALYQWIKNEIKDVYETKFVKAQFNRALKSLNEYKRRTIKLKLLYETDPNAFISSLLSNFSIKALAIDSESSNLNYFEGELYSLQFSYDGISGHFCLFKDIDKESNSEMKRIKIKLYESVNGRNSFIKNSGAELIEKTELGELYKRDIDNDEPIVSIKVFNSTYNENGKQDEYWLRVPPAIKSVKEAVAWTFGMTEKEYKPEIET
jgi:hypothetical protein